MEGYLRLPTQRALTDPSLNYGSEWSSAATRPVQSRSEVPLFAARFETAYVAALSLSDTTSPYRATSLWGVYAKEYVPRAMLHLMQGEQTPNAAAIDHADRVEPVGPVEPVEPVHLNVVAPAAQVAAKRYFSKPVMALTAVACAALITWLLFEYKPGASDNSSAATTAEVGTQSLQADANARPDLPASEPAVIAAVEPAPVKTTQTATTPPVAIAIASAPAVVKAGTIARADAVAKADAIPRAPAVAKVDAIPSAPAVAKPHTIASTPAAAKTRTIASTNTSATTKHKTSAAHLVAESTARKHTRHVRTVSSPHPQRALALRAPAAEKRIASHAPAAPMRTLSASIHGPRASQVSNPMSPEALYAMLQHSPTLDSNSGSASSHGGAQAQNAR
ncbi:hypothetical protein [Caballeronia cordobensis]|uniref:hypothetical protein n=1 Tax=Caballeronia cordobensis TaxID=1353886 RepID=UPI001F36AF7D|nr:hypothetical protein [Caballeronia cordobensis]